MINHAGSLGAAWLASRQPARSSCAHRDTLSSAKNIKLYLSANGAAAAMARNHNSQIMQWRPGESCRLKRHSLRSMTIFSAR